MADLESFRSDLRTWLDANAPAGLRGASGSELEGVWGGRKWKWADPDQKRWLEVCAERGYTAPTWPREYGGGGLDKAEAKVLAEELRQAKLPPPVIGFGLNVSMGSDDNGMIGRPWTDLATASGSEIDRNRLAATILGRLVSGLTEINRSGMPKWLEAWRHRDMLLGRAVVVDGTPPVAGIAAGIDDSGALLLHTETGHCTVAGGEVSVLQIGDAV